jgi:hypothetical protein
MFLKNNRTPAERKEFIGRYRQWRAQADNEYRERRDALLEVIWPYRSLPLLGYVYFSETTGNFETFRESEHPAIVVRLAERQAATRRQRRPPR